MRIGMNWMFLGKAGTPNAHYDGQIVATIVHTGDIGGWSPDTWHSTVRLNVTCVEDARNHLLNAGTREYNSLLAQLLIHRLYYLCILY